MEEQPAPREAFQSWLGPLSGHLACQPVSRETPLRSGPRQRYQSAAWADTTSIGTVKVESNQALKLIRAELAEGRGSVNCGAGVRCPCQKDRARFDWGKGCGRIWAVGVGTRRMGKEKREKIK